MFTTSKNQAVYNTYETVYNEYLTYNFENYNHPKKTVPESYIDPFTLDIVDDPIEIIFEKPTEKPKLVEKALYDQSILKALSDICNLKEFQFTKAQFHTWADFANYAPIDELATNDNLNQEIRENLKREAVSIVYQGIKGNEDTKINAAYKNEIDTFISAIKIETDSLKKIIENAKKGRAANSVLTPQPPQQTPTPTIVGVFKQFFK